MDDRSDIVITNYMAKQIRQDILFTTSRKRTIVIVCIPMQVTVFRTENILLGTLMTQQLLFMRFFLHDVFGMGEV